MTRNTLRIKPGAPRRAFFSLRDLTKPGEPLPAYLTLGAPPSMDAEPKQVELRLRVAETR